MQQRLTDRLVEENIEKTFLAFHRCGKAYQRGFFDGVRFFSEMERLLDLGFWGFLQENGMELRINEVNYSSFANAFQSFPECGDDDHREHTPWLFDRNEAPCEASPRDRMQVFLLMKQFRLTPECFEPVPAGLPKCSLHGIHQYRTSGVYGIDFHCVDDGGLIEDAAPVGKTFRLKNDQGLEAVLTVKEDRRYMNRSGMDFDEYVIPTEGGVAVRLAEFLAEGYIEGYTALERTGNTEILIRLRDGGTKICWLAFWRNPEDDRAFFDYPLWQEFFCWDSEKRAKAKKLLTPFFDTFKEGS